MPDENTETTTEGQEPEETAVEETTGTDATEAEETGDSTTDDDFDPEKARKEIKRLRAEAGKARTEAKRQAAEEARREAEAEFTAQLEALKAESTSKFKEIAKLLGYEKDEASELTPEQVIEKITKERDEERQAREKRDQEFRALKLELAVQDAANMHGALPDKLLDSRRFMKSIEPLDPSEDGYQVKVADAVAKAVEADGSLKAAEPKPKPPAVSGGTTVAGTKTKRFEDMTVDELREARIHRRT